MLLQLPLNRYRYVEVAGTLVWTPTEKPPPLVQRLVKNTDLELDESGYVKTYEMQHTNVERLYAAGDVQGWRGAIESAHDGGMAATSIVHEWFD